MNFGQPLKDEQESAAHAAIARAIALNPAMHAAEAASNQVEDGVARELSDSISLVKANFFQL